MQESKWNEWNRREEWALFSGVGEQSEHSSSRIKLKVCDDLSFPSE